MQNEFGRCNNTLAQKITAVFAETPQKLHLGINVNGIFSGCGARRFSTSYIFFTALVFADWIMLHLLRNTRGFYRLILLGNLPSA